MRCNKYLQTNNGFWMSTTSFKINLKFLADNSLLQEGHSSCIDEKFQCSWLFSFSLTWKWLSDPMEASAFKCLGKFWCAAPASVVLAASWRSISLSRFSSTDFEVSNGVCDLIFFSSKLWHARSWLFCWSFRHSRFSGWAEGSLLMLVEKLLMCPVATERRSCILFVCWVAGWSRGYHSEDGLQGVEFSLPVEMLWLIFGRCDRFLWLEMEFVTWMREDGWVELQVMDQEGKLRRTEVACRSCWKATGSWMGIDQPTGETKA